MSILDDEEKILERVNTHGRNAICESWFGRQYDNTEILCEEPEYYDMRDFSGPGYYPIKSPCQYSDTPTLEKERGRIVHWGVLPDNIKVFACRRLLISEVDRIFRWNHDCSWRLSEMPQLEGQKYLTVAKIKVRPNPRTTDRYTIESSVSTPILAGGDWIDAEVVTIGKNYKGLKSLPLLIFNIQL